MDTDRSFLKANRFFRYQQKQAVFIFVKKVVFRVETNCKGFCVFLHVKMNVA